MKNRSRNRNHHHQKEKARGPKKASKAQIDLFGKHAVSEAWTNRNRNIKALYITEKTLAEFEAVLENAERQNIERPAPQIISKEELDHMAPQGAVHQGIAVQCAPLEEIDISDIIRIEDAKEKSILLMLDQVTDPHNVGAIIRSAAAFGAAGIIMQRKHAPELTGVLAKTACGGVEHLPVAFETNLTRSLETLQDAGYFAIGLDERGEKTLADLPSYKKAVIVLGAEGTGLRRLVREQCDILARLPTNPPIASLNVSNAAAVALYDLSVK